MHEVYEQYRSDVEPELAETMDETFDSIRRAAPDLEVESKWGKPCFVGDGNVVSVVAHSAHINLQFFRGAEFDDPQGVLEGTGKAMRHLKVQKGADVPHDTIAALVAEARSLDGE